MRGLKAELNLLLKFFPWCFFFGEQPCNIILLMHATEQAMKLKEIELIIQLVFKLCIIAGKYFSHFY